jgi:hypothetical protein
MFVCVEFKMPGNQTDLSWQARLVARFPMLFRQEFNGRVTAPGHPSVRDGRRDLVETPIGRIATAVAMAPAGSLKFGPIKTKFATLRMYLDSRTGVATIDKVICLAAAHSACTCETCGERGRLFKAGGWYLTACGAHAKGKPISQRPGLENLHITHRLVTNQKGYGPWMPADRS